MGKRTLIASLGENSQQLGLISDGSGHGSDGYVNGNGSGNGDGNGSGNGDGDGYGYGYGNGC